MTVRYDEVLGPLREAYDARAAWRDGLTKEPWKLAERQAFRERLTPGTRLLEIGAGTGHDSAYFQDEGFAVVAADLSAVMVEHCRDKGIEAHVADFLHLDFPVGSFDAVFAMNCLLHVPNHDLPAVLAAVRGCCAPAGCSSSACTAGTRVPKARSTTTSTCRRVSSRGAPTSSCSASPPARGSTSWTSTLSIPAAATGSSR